MEFRKLQKIIMEVMNVDEDEISMDTTFVDDLGADSLDIFQIIMGIEETFDIEIDNDDAEKIVTVGDAVEQIKELEKQLDAANSQVAEDSQTIDDLNSQVADLSTYKEDQAAFEEEKQKYYEEVVFSDKAPDIKEYKAYYESIDSENAEVLYKQVVQQLQDDQKVTDYANTYASMKPKEAAAIFDSMTDNFDLVAKILGAMDSDSRANILGAMNSDNAAKITKIMNPS